MVRIVPVIDVMNGQVVRAVGGRRELYGPLHSQLTTSTVPIKVADALLAIAGVNELYVADLDGLLGRKPALEWLGELTGRGVHVLVDLGVKTAADAKPLQSMPLVTVVAGSETLTAMDELATLCSTFGPDRVVFSLDLRNGKVVGDEAVWGAKAEPQAVVDRVVAAGITRILVLELARVGTGIGPGVTELCGQLRQRHPDIELIAGGGVRDRDDINRLAIAGADAVLVASALHDGTLNPNGPMP